MSKFITKSLGLLALIMLTSLMTACSEGDTPKTKQDDAIKVVGWGPKSTKAGKGFLVQSNGDSVIWFEFTGAANANTLEVWFGNQKLTGVAVVPGKGGSATVPPELFAKPGTVPVFLINTTNGVKAELGLFEILP